MDLEALLFMLKALIGRHIMKKPKQNVSKEKKNPLKNGWMNLRLMGILLRKPLMQQESMV